MNFKQLADIVVATNDALYTDAVKAVNSRLTLRNWLFGFCIVQYEQNGKDRAKYGAQLLLKLAKTINIKGLSAPELSRCRQFYVSYPQILGTVSQELKMLPAIGQTLSDQLKLYLTTEKKSSSKNPTQNLGTVSQQFTDADLRHTQQLLHSVSFSHFTELIKIDDPVKRQYYEMLATRQTLSVRELRRQIDTLSYERLGLSTDKKKALARLEQKIKPQEPHDAVKDLYFFEFLKLPHKEVVEESDIEQALLNHFQEFILELGMGFCIEDRQKKILIGDEYFFIDLVLYHRILKCHVLVELKVDAFNHAHIAQLNTYLNYYKKNVCEPNDTPPIGILLVADRNKPLVEYALGGVDNKMFVSKYKLQLPAKKDLENFVKEELKKL
ncbi:MAG: cytoplasmic protein [Chlorobiaceae bacterium]|nr:cytoplasmic protein [Chlorobiaceae bacterium]